MGKKVPAGDVARGADLRARVAWEEQERLQSINAELARLQVCPLRSLGFPPDDTRSGQASLQIVGLNRDFAYASVGRGAIYSPLKTK